MKKHQLHEVYSIRSTILFNLALVYQRQNNDLDAIKILLNEAIPLAKKANDKIEMANLYRFLGLIFYNKNDLQKAAEYVGLAIKTLEAKKLSHENYAEDLLQFYLFYVEICSLQNKLSEASNYLQKAKSLLDNHPDSNLYIDYYSAKGTLENQYKNYRNAIAIFDLGIAKAQLVNDTYSVINFKLLKFESLKELKQYDQAKNLLLEVLSNREVNVEDRKNYSKDLSLIYKQLGDYKNAILYSERYMSLSDSLDKISNKNEIANLEARYKSKENENKIKELEIQKQQALLTSRNDRMNYIVFGLISFILLLVTIFLIKNSKNQKRIAAQKEINYHQKLNALEIQKALEVMQAMIGGEEAERKRIARDLHDGIGSRLSALKMQVQSVTSNTNSTSILEDFSESLSLSIIELRQIAFNLMPETLLKLGLELALKDLCHSLNRENVTIDFQANEISKSIKANDQVTIFRIVQELINNALKHSHCSEIIVDCSQNRDLFLITVEDNGKGFNPEELEQYKGLGLKNIKNRVELLKGKLDIQSRPESGTVFNIELLLQSYDE
ncbi:tetratricopeptide repeat-containing sensor histidine kinase [Flavobacterium sp.]|uniref:tetratricopeptide repeat-containing sensor histidine kinase n=1 Tax=Flavobacterium sp. TaxID=239 RepID=UPI0026085024|nr:tetratricopeptide repeat-containing sensor histidine kinase [Flavobacterium sp.]